MTASTHFLTPPPVNELSKGPIGTIGGALMIGPGMWKVAAPGTPVDGVVGTGTGAGWMGIGSEFTDTTSGNLYINGGTKASPVWKLVTRAA